MLDHDYRAALRLASTGDVRALATALRGVQALSVTRETWQTAYDAANAVADTAWRLFRPEAAAREPNVYWPHGTDVGGALGRIAADAYSVVDRAWRVHNGGASAS